VHNIAIVLAVFDILVGKARDVQRRGNKHKEVHVPLHLFSSSAIDSSPIAVSYPINPFSHPYPVQKTANEE